MRREWMQDSFASKIEKLAEEEKDWLRRNIRIRKRHKKIVNEKKLTNVESNSFNIFQKIEQMLIFVPIIF